MKELMNAEEWNRLWQDFRSSNAGTSGRRMDQGEFWNHRAESFANNTVKSRDNSRREQVFAFLRAHGALEPAQTILDIGSGPGSFAIPFADLGNQVLALDPSPRMLDLMRELIPPHLGNSIEDREGLWEEADPVAEGWVKRFDLVFASMCPGIHEQTLIEKMMQCSRRWCYISAFSGPRHFQVYDEIFLALNGHPYPNHFNDIIFPFNLVYALGYKPSLHFAESSYTQKENPDVFLAELSELLPTEPGPSDRALIEDIIARHTEDGKVHQPVSSTVGMMLWKVD